MAAAATAFSIDADAEDRATGHTTMRRDVSDEHAFTPLCDDICSPNNSPSGERASVMPSV